MLPWYQDNPFKLIVVVSFSILSVAYLSWETAKDGDEFLVILFVAIIFSLFIWVPAMITSIKRAPRLFWVVNLLCLFIVFAVVMNAKQMSPTDADRWLVLGEFVWILACLLGVVSYALGGKVSR